MQNSTCFYYQATIDRSKTWFVVGVLRNEDHIAFDRSMNPKLGIFEFFVPADQEVRFLQIINYFIAEKLISDFKKIT